MINLTEKQIGNKDLFHITLSSLGVVLLFISMGMASSGSSSLQILGFPLFVLGFLGMINFTFIRITAW